MSQAPSMPMYWDAYIADTTHLTTEEHGAYLLLLAAMWRRNGTVPDDDKDIARIVGLTQAKWIKVRARISPLLTFDDDHISQKNLLKIWKNTQEKIAKNRENGALGGRPVSNKNSDIGKANGSISHNPNVTIPEPEPEPEPEKDLFGSDEPHNVGFDDRFEELWSVYPKAPNQSKKAAREKYKSALKKNINAEMIIDAAKKYATWLDSGGPKDFRPNPKHLATWLSKEGWADDIPDVSTRRRPAPSHMTVVR